jgi:hypothetical protein
MEPKKGENNRQVEIREKQQPPHICTMLQPVDPSQLQDTPKKLSRVHKRWKGNTQ